VGRRDRAVIATKVSPDHLAPEDLRASCEASLRRLRTDVIDLYQIHWPSRQVPLADTVGALQRLQEEGKIRAFGVSNFGVGDLGDLLALGPCTSNQLPYSLLWRAIEYGIQTVCVEHGISILTYSPMEQGLLTGKFGSADEVPDGRARTRFFSGDRPLARHGEAGHEQETFAAIHRIRAIADGAGLPMADPSAGLAAAPARRHLGAGWVASARADHRERESGLGPTHGRYPGRAGRGDPAPEGSPRPEPGPLSVHLAIPVDIGPRSRLGGDARCTRRPPRRLVDGGSTHRPGEPSLLDACPLRILPVILRWPAACGPPCA